MKKLYRSNENKMIAGVCGGMGEYFNIDPTFIRLGWFFFNIAGILAYIFCCIIIPKRSY